jgi:hypothetical protein
MTVMAAPATNKLTSWRAALQPLWPAGLILFLIVAGQLMPIRAEERDWLQYLLLGGVLPILLLCQLRRRSSAFQERIQTAFSLLFVLLCLLLFALSFKWYVAALVLPQIAAVAAVQRLRGGDPHRPSGSRLVYALVNTASWMAVVRLVWWTPPGVFMRSPYSMVVCGLSLLLVVAVLYGEDRPPGPRTRRVEALGSVVALLVIGAMAFRTDGLDPVWCPRHHWAAVVGPAELVRQGGWLLWDVPAQYGFLSTLTLALLPCRTVLESLYFAQAALQFTAAVLFYGAFRSLSAGLVNQCFALLLTVAAVFLVAGDPIVLVGPSLWPAIGAFRFIWVHLLLGILFWWLRRSDQAAPRGMLWTGCAVWLLGVLWSFESAVYCSVTWLPLYGWLVLTGSPASEAGGPKLRERLWQGRWWFLLPPVLLLSAVSLVTLYYWVHLGLFPDWRAFNEHAVSFRNGFMSIPIYSTGPVWALVLVYCAFATTAAATARRKGVALLLGGGGALWAVSSYYVGRSHPVNVGNLLPVFCVGAMLALYCATRFNSPSLPLVKASLVPLLTIILASTYCPWTQKMQRIQPECLANH